VMRRSGRTARGSRPAHRRPHWRASGAVMLAAGLLAVALSAPWRSALAQADTTQATALPCDGQPITEIDIRTEPPTLPPLLRRVRLLQRAIDQLHATTREDVVRRFLLLAVGQPCRELRRAESERILRAQPFLADARVVALSDGAGGVRIDVVTVDELSYTIGVGARGSQLSGFKLGNQNVMGDGVAAEGRWRSEDFYRDQFAARVTDYQLLGRPYQLTLAGERRRLGSQWQTDLSHPFLTDLQRIAWRATAGSVTDYVEFRRLDPGASALVPPHLSFQRLSPGLPSVGVTRTHWDAGGIVRIGAPGRLSLFGASFSSEEELNEALPVFVTDSGVYSAAADAPPLVNRYGHHRVARVNALWGVRNIEFITVNGFDALTAPQDVRTGFQLGALFGRSLTVLGSDDDDIFVSADLYAGRGTRRSFVALQLAGEGRQDGDSVRWDGVLTSGRLAWYAKPAPTNTMITSLELGAGWRQRVPFQLSLADANGGVPGFRRSQEAGSQRIVARVEDRIAMGQLGRLSGFGIAVFGHAGKMWAGDAPFGVDTPVRASVGAGLLAAVPARSKRLWRLDLIQPVTGGDGRRWEFRLTTRNYTRSFWEEPDDITRGRSRSVPSSIFTWP
jgi:hypothetical protein